jgi:hypothetical protein
MPAVAETASIVVFLVGIVVGSCCWPSSGVRGWRGRRRDVGDEEVVFEIGIATVIEVGKHLSLCIVFGKPTRVSVIDTAKAWTGETRRRRGTYRYKGRTCDILRLSRRVVKFGVEVYRAFTA